MKTYVIMKHRQSAVCIYGPVPHEVTASLHDAKEKCQALNRKSTTNRYWYVKVKNDIAI